MGYDIRPIVEINTFDYSLCSGYSTKDTVRKSIDEQFFVVEGDTFNTYTHAQILVEMAKPNWTDNTI